MKYGCGVILLFILTLTRNAAKTREIKLRDSDFVSHNIVQPVVQQGRTKRELTSTRDASGTHHSEIQLTVPVNGEQYFLDLQLNKDLVTREHTLQYQKEGQTVQNRPKLEELDLCYYTGRVRGKPNSLVAVSTCHGVRGVIHDGKTMRYIEPVRGPEIQSPHYLYDQKNFNTSNSVGNYEYQSHVYDLSNRSEEIDVKGSQAVRHKRDTYEQIREPYDANSETRYIELVIVVDNALFRDMEGDLQTVHSKMFEIVNIVNALFSKHNIYVALVGVKVWNERDEIVIDNNGTITLGLERFGSYRRWKLALEMPNDAAFLLTKQIFLEKVLGAAFTGTICTTEFASGIASFRTDNATLATLRQIAFTIFHELGHILGFEYDFEHCKCPEGALTCIMNTKVDRIIPRLPVHWSFCNMDSLAKTYRFDWDYCLRNKPITLFKSPNCGNGFIDPGEQCDCGTEAGVGGINLCHACCHAATCTLRSNATCGAGACCDFTTCKLKPAGVVCRATDKECDLPEFCTGSSEFCPADVYLMDSTPCGEGDDAAHCVRGACRSHTNQCRHLGNATSESSDQQCYDRNTEGTHYGNCGFDQVKLKFIPCLASDILCGKLQCRSPNVLRDFFSGARYTYSNMNISSNGSNIMCQTVTYKYGLDVIDPGLVPDGARCGNERMCLKQKCVSVESVREEIRNGETSVCPSDCSGHGVCNSEGHCHCDEGFAPPLCAEPGSGGSVDSGPVGLISVSDLEDPIPHPAGLSDT